MNVKIVIFKVVAPTIADPNCQDQLVESARDVAKSVDGCVSTCQDVCRDDVSLNELAGAANDVTKSLNDLLNHVKVKIFSDLKG